MQRRMAAILAADMAGFSRLMEADETGTLARQKRHFEELIRPAIARWNGRIVKLTGDGLLAEFASVVDAVHAAVHVQREMAAREADAPEARRIRYRVAVNLGDVIHDEDDVYGDGVNIAARLEGLAEPGGVVVSGTAYDHLKANVDVGYQDLGERRLKNIETPVRVYRVVDDPAAAGVVRRARTPAWRRWAAAAAVLAAVAAAGAAWQAWRPDFAPADPARMAYALPEEPSIAVLPFQNLTGDPVQDYVSQGMTEAVIGLLATVPDLLTVTGFAPGDDSAATPAEVAEAFGVQYVLVGSHLESGDRLRVSARLQDTLSGNTVWGVTYDLPLAANSIYDLQREIATDVAMEIGVELRGADLDRAYGDGFRSIEDWRRAREASEVFQRWDELGNREALKVYEALLQEYPDHPGVLTFLGWIHYQRVFAQFSKDPEADLRIAAKYAALALEANPEFAGAYGVLGWTAVFSGDRDAALRHAQAHIAITGPAAHPNIGGILLRLGRAHEAEEIFRRTMRTQPRHHDWVPQGLAESLMRQGDYDEATEIFEGLIGSELRAKYIQLAAARDIVAISQLDGWPSSTAEDALDRLVAMHPVESIDGARRAMGPQFDEDWVATYLNALRAAGVPETTPTK